MYLCVIGTSNIVHHHLKCAINLKIKIFSITSTNKNSKKVKQFYKKYKIENKFLNWKDSIKNAGKIKNCHFLIASRIKDNIKIINECSKYNKQIFVEKPVALKSKTFQTLIKSRNIFVGYNRIFYNNIKFTKQLIDKKTKYLINVKCPEANKGDIIRNSCHIISILIYLFGQIKVREVIRNRNFITGILTSKNNSIINISFVYQSSDNFSIEILSRNQKIVLSPIENLEIYDGISIIKKGGNNIFTPKLSYKNNEYYKNSFKPGFYNQMSLFKSIVNGGKGFFPNIKFAKDVLEVCERLVYEKNVK